MKQETDRLPHLLKGVCGGWEGVQVRVVRGGKVGGGFFTNEDTLAFAYACTNRDEREK